MYCMTMIPKSRSKFYITMCDFLINVLSILIHGDISLPDADLIKQFYKMH